VHPGSLAVREWQERVKSIYCASYAQNEDAKITGAVLDALAEARAEALEDGDKAGCVYWAELIRAHHWGRKFGSSNVARVKRALLDDRVIESRLETDDDGNPIPGKHTGWVR
jgi:hypothetical protein